MWVLGDFKEGLKEVLDDLFKVLDQFVALVDVKETRNLDDPPDVVRIHVVVDGPLGQLVPLLRGTSVNRQSELKVLVFGLFNVVHHFVDQLACQF